MSFLAGVGPRAIAHRGWHTDDLTGMENSLPAFRRAVAEGYQYLETDVHLTADGVVVAFHDDVLDRVTDGRGPIAGLTYDEIRRARIAGREEIPTLAAVLDACPTARLIIDPKCDAVVGPLMDVLHEADAWHRVCLGSFSDARLRTIRRAAPPGTATSLGPRQVLGLRAGAAARATAGAVAAQIPMRFGRIPLVTPRTLRHARAAGIEVHVWTVNDAPTMLQLLDLGADGIITDRPDVLRSLLASRGQW